MNLKNIEPKHASPNKSGLYRVNYNGSIYFARAKEKPLTELSIMTLEKGVGPHVGEDHFAGDLYFHNHYPNVYNS